MIKIENWSVTTDIQDPYLPPEQQRSCLQGEVYGHPSHEDGKYVMTTPIVDVKDKIITTQSGRVYELGAIDPKYLKWCEETEGVRVPVEGDWIRYVNNKERTSSRNEIR